jgi:3-methylfumaryl-CoA hydratase
MRAGGQFKIERPIRIGDELERRSKITGISEKNGASGPLVFVRIEHEIHANGALAIVEEESIAYRGAAAPAAAVAPAHTSPPAAVSNPSETRFPTNPVLLFRISALTFNGHRIHYDNDYARSEEGYPDRVVQGPLLALLMLEHLHKSHAPSELQHFQYRAVAPSFCGDDIAVSDVPDKEKGRVRVFARNGAGAEAVVGEAVYVS